MENLFLQDKELEIYMTCMHDMQIFIIKGLNKTDKQISKQTHIRSQTHLSNLIPPTHVFKVSLFVTPMI